MSGTWQTMIEILNSKKPYEIYPLSEKAITIQFGTIISEEAWDKVNKLNQSLLNQPFSGLASVVPAYASLSVFFEPVEVAKSSMNGTTVFDKVAEYLKILISKAEDFIPSARKIVEIPVCYGHELGPDLEYVALHNNLGIEDVIKLHTSAEYCVYMIGFIPGFAYLGGMPEGISTPRKQEPRKAVAAGSVGIAGNQTGIYPLQTPGGWQLIGQTPIKLFDSNRDVPALLQAGNIVKFKAITDSEFRELSH